MGNDAWRAKGCSWTQASCRRGSIGAISFTRPLDDWPSAGETARNFGQPKRSCWKIGAAFREPGQRSIFLAIWDRFHSDSCCRLGAVSGSLLSRGVELFRQRPDKTWSLTDCISFELMHEQGLMIALTCDHHFKQAGFRALLLEEAGG
jgi:hypothetical protein